MPVPPGGREKKETIMVLPSIVTHSNGGLSFPNASLAQKQILQK